MTRIFEALKKSQVAPEPVAFPPAASAAAPIQPLPMARGGHPAVRTAASRVATFTVTPLREELAREMAALRIGLEASLEERSSRVVMFMSSVAREGTTSVAAQFAALLAADPRARTLLLDLNTRRPGLAARLGTGRAVPGAAGRGDPVALALATVADVSRGSGIRPADARAVLTGVIQDYDWIVIDGPPVLEAPEAADLAGLVDGVVLVVRAGHTKRPVVSRAVDLLRKSGARVLGTVLNRRRLEIPDFLYRRI
jgi:succinoglycan biosynthesis transport protein ExoP